LDEYSVILSFKTAWNGVPNIVQKLTEMFQTIIFDYKYSDEDMGYNCGEGYGENGEFSFLMLQGGSEEAIETYALCWGYDIDDFYQDDEDKDEEVYEYCPYCEDEVKLNNEFKVQVCPNCGHAIVPCNICQLDSCCSNCPLDVLCRRKNDEIDEDAGIEVTLSSFIELFDKQIPSYQSDGYTISIAETENVNAHKLLFRYDFNYGIYILTNITHNGQAYTWDELPSPGSLFDGLWNVSGEEMDSFKVKPNFE
jgi:predicted RNA-binding Zn-ribbon protein involved in translation (DUF1610 family)